MEAQSDNPTMQTRLGLRGHPDSGCCGSWTAKRRHTNSNRSFQKNQEGNPATSSCCNSRANKYTDIDIPTQCKRPQHKQCVRHSHNSGPLCWTVWILVWTTCLLYPVAAQTGAWCDIPISDKFIQDIPENWPKDTVLRHLQITGDDNEIVLTNQKTEEHVVFDPATRNLTLVKPLDYEKQEYVSLEIGCDIKATQQHIKIDVRIILVDVNDNPPLFEKDEYSTTVNENSPIGTTVIQNIVAEDLDKDNWYITYEILEGPYSSYFDIPIPARGEIVLQEALDYETVKTMTVTVVAKDNHPPVLNVDQPILNSTTTVVINVIDGDDRNPDFVNAPYIATLPEDTQVGTTLVVTPEIKAIDGDAGINSPVLYSLVPDVVTGDSDYFTITQNADVILAQGGLKRGKQFAILVQAVQTDNEERYTTTLLRVYVTAANENPPVFPHLRYFARVVENIPTGTNVLTVQATDNDEGAILNYSFGAGQRINDFEIFTDNNKGVIMTSEPLDYERQKQYNISVIATDGRNVAQTEVTIDVINFNDNAPQFTETNYYFKGKRGKDNFVGQVTATDPDNEGKVTYYFQEFTQQFSINDQGEIFITAESEDLPQAVYKLFVIALDAGDPAQEKATVVTVDFGSGTGVLAPVTGEEENDLIMIIALGAVSGILLVVVIILLVYIYRNSTRKPPRNDFVKSQSFESRLNLQSTLRKGPYVETNPEGLAYKPTQAHHLALYDHIGHDQIDEDGTTPQENPFVPDDTYTTPRYARSSDINDNTSTKHLSSGSPTSQLRRQMNYINEIEYETAVAPLEHMDDSSPDSQSLRSSSGAPSIEGGSMHTSFRAGGSTQKLVTPKGTVGKKSGVSFIEDNGSMTIYGQNHTMDPNLSGSREADRPGITVYY